MPSKKDTDTPQSEFVRELTSLVSSPHAPISQLRVDIATINKDLGRHRPCDDQNSFYCREWAQFVMKKQFGSIGEKDKCSTPDDLLLDKNPLETLKAKLEELRIENQIIRMIEYAHQWIGNLCSRAPTIEPYRRVNLAMPEESVPLFKALTVDRSGLILKAQDFQMLDSVAPVLFSVLEEGGCGHDANSLTPAKLEQQMQVFHEQMLRVGKEDLENLGLKLRGVWQEAYDTLGELQWLEELRQKNMNSEILDAKVGISFQDYWAPIAEEGKKKKDVKILDEAFKGFLEMQRKILKEYEDKTVHLAVNSARFLGIKTEEKSQNSDLNNTVKERIKTLQELVLNTDMVLEAYYNSKDTVVGRMEKVAQKEFKKLIKRMELTKTQYLQRTSQTLLELVPMDMYSQFVKGIIVGLAEKGAQTELEEVRSHRSALKDLTDALESSRSSLHKAYEQGVATGRRELAIVTGRQLLIAARRAIENERAIVKGNRLLSEVQDKKKRKKKKKKSEKSVDNDFKSDDEELQEANDKKAKQKEAKVEPKAEVKSEPKMQVKLEPKVEVKVEAKKEPKVEVKKEPKLEVKKEPKVEAKKEPKIEIKIEPKEEVYTKQKEKVLAKPEANKAMENKEEPEKPKEKPKKKNKEKKNLELPKVISREVSPKVSSVPQTPVPSPNTIIKPKENGLEHAEVPKLVITGGIGIPNPEVKRLEMRKSNIPEKIVEIQHNNMDGSNREITVEKTAAQLIAEMSSGIAESVATSSQGSPGFAFGVPVPPTTLPPEYSYRQNIVDQHGLLSQLHRLESEHHILQQDFTRLREHALVMQNRCNHLAERNQALEAALRSRDMQVENLINQGAQNERMHLNTIARLEMRIKELESRQSGSASESGYFPSPTVGNGIPPAYWDSETDRKWLSSSMRLSPLPTETPKADLWSFPSSATIIGPKQEMFWNAPPKENTPGMWNPTSATLKSDRDFEPENAEVDRIGVNNETRGIENEQKPRIWLSSAKRNALANGDLAPINTDRALLNARKYKLGLESESPTATKFRGTVSKPPPGFGDASTEDPSQSGWPRRVRQRSKVNLHCAKCGERGHESKECTTSCRNCGSPLHSAEICEKSSRW